MQGIWKRGVTVAAIALSLGLVLMAITAAAPPKATMGNLEQQAEQTQGSFGRAERGSREFPTPDTPTLTFGPSTDSGGLSSFECLGTVSHASIDNNFTRLMEQARRKCGTGS
jgi:hypothetical protein